MQMDEPMKKKIWMYACVACIAIVLFFAFYKFSALKTFVQSILGLISPFILGFGIAFLLNKPMMMIETKLLGNWNQASTQANDFRCFLYCAGNCGGLFVFLSFDTAVIGQYYIFGGCISRIFGRLSEICRSNHFRK